MDDAALDRCRRSARILAVTAGTFTRKDQYDLVLVSNARGTKQSVLSIAHETEKFNFRTVTPVLSYADSFACTRSAVAVDVDGDTNTDVILVLAEPAKSLAVVFGKGDGTFREQIEWIRGVNPSNDDSIVLCDVDGDGLADMTFVDALRQEVVTLYGLGGGKFGAPVSICSAAGVGEIAVGSLRDVTTRDLVMSQPEKGTVAILFSPFHR